MDALLAILLFILLLPFYIVKFALWLAISLIVIVFMGIGCILNACHPPEVVDTLEGLWSHFPPEME